MMAAMEKELVSHGQEKNDYTWLFKTKNKTKGEKTKTGNQYLQFWTVSRRHPDMTLAACLLAPSRRRGWRNRPDGDSWHLGWRAQAVAAGFRDRTPDQIYQFAKKYCLHLNKSHKWTDDDRAELIACVALLPTLDPNPVSLIIGEVACRVEHPHASCPARRPKRSSSLAATDCLY